jgi:hypothetical protein
MGHLGANVPLGPGEAGRSHVMADRGFKAIDQVVDNSFEAN